jgi:hypothetical protein
MIPLTYPLGSSPAAMPHISLLGLQLPQAALQPASVQQPPDSPEDKNTTGVMPSISGSINYSYLPGKFNQYLSIR